MSDLRACDKCQTAAGVVERYHLQRRKRHDSGVVSHGFGSIDLCRNCWERICRPRMRAYVKPETPRLRAVG